MAFPPDNLLPNYYIPLMPVKEQSKDEREEEEEDVHDAKGE